MFKELTRKKNQMSQKDATELLINGKYGVLGTLSDDGYPYTIPMNYVYLNQKIYFHSAKIGHKIENIKNHEKVSFTVVGKERVSGKEVTTKYESVTLFGIAKIIPTNKTILLELIKKYAKDFMVEGVKSIKEDFNSVAIFEIDIKHITGKATREGEDK